MDALERDRNAQTWYRIQMTIADAMDRGQPMVFLPDVRKQDRIPMIKDLIRDLRKKLIDEGEEP